MFEEKDENSIRFVKINGYFVPKSMLDNYSDILAFYLYCYSNNWHIKNWELVNQFEKKHNIKITCDSLIDKLSGEFKIRRILDGLALDRYLGDIHYKIVEYISSQWGKNFDNNVHSPYPDPDKSFKEIREYAHKKAIGIIKEIYEERDI